MKTIVIYRSILGTSERYAKWLAEELDTKCINYKKITDKDLNNYDNVVLVGPTYMSKILLQNFIKNNWKILKNKKVIFVNIGMLTVDNNIVEESWKEIHKQIIKIKISGKIGAINQSNVDRRNLEKVIKEIKK